MIAFEERKKKIKVIRKCLKFSYILEIKSFESMSYSNLIP